MTWSLYKGDDFLKPLIFSNSKTQEDIVKRVLELINNGKKVIFIRGACGTGKSAIALNIAKEIGKASIIVPSKSLQTQYKKDYEKDKYVLKSNNKKLKISVITGRNNHKCKFLEENKKSLPVFKREVNSKLFDIFDNKRKEIDKIIEKDTSADNDYIPCKIKIQEKNWDRIKQYLKQNREIDIKNFEDIKDVKRISIASVCPYWSPVFESKYEFKQPSMTNAIKKKYMGMDNKEFIFYHRKPGCTFYEQFERYIDSDVLVFNSLKYKLEFILGRKPKTKVEIIDECDEFLDSFSNQRKINLDLLQKSLMGLKKINEKTADSLAEINNQIINIKKDISFGNVILEDKILSLKETRIYALLKFFLKNEEILEELDEENYLFDVFETAKIFENYFDESYIIFEKKNNSIIVNIVTTNLEKKFKELEEKNEVLVLMSGTLHSEQVLNEIFGLRNFEIVEAETKTKGTINILKTGLEKDCSYLSFNNGLNNRKDYLIALDKSIEMSIKPTLVHVIAFYDLPSENEIEQFGLKNLISREDLKKIQHEDKEGLEIRKFKEGKINILFSTKASRGIDFPGKECRSIIFTKYPNPDVKNPFWKILKMTNPFQYWSFYKDKAKRELLQKVYRGLRSEDDYIYLLSPDSRVLDFFEKLSI